MAYIDRINVGFAALAMRTDLHMNATEFGSGTGGGHLMGDGGGDPGGLWVPWLEKFVLGDAGDVPDRLGGGGYRVDQLDREPE